MLTQFDNHAQITTGDQVGVVRTDNKDSSYVAKSTAEIASSPEEK